jgi:deoxyribodipyrimidine photolyase
MTVETSPTPNPDIRASPTRTTLVWFRRDLRLDDHPALAAAAAEHGPLVPLFIWAPDEEGDWPLGRAARSWLAESLRRFDTQLRARGSRLIVRGGPSAQTLPEFALAVGAGLVTWNRSLEPAGLRRDARVARSLRAEFASFPWEEDPVSEAAWQTGRTGYPLVDAAIRQLLASGWMHNRVRMVAASFLVKDLLVPWQHGTRFFWEQLVDANLANNTLGWQWVAGSGADAAPFFRIFNPVTQGQRYDPDGAYVRRWVPEIASLPDRFIHAPWRAPDEAPTRAGLYLGETYPLPLVDHGEARRRALAAFAQTRGR